VAISCVYCGGAHATASQVRECWSRHDEPEPEARPAEPDAVAPEPPSTPVAGLVGAPASLAGPDALGRNVVVLPGTSPPDPWAAAPVVRIDPSTLADPAPAVATLQGLAHAGRRAAIELAVEFDDPPRSVERRSAYELGPRFGFDLDVLHHLVWSNSVDARSPGVAHFAPVEAAVAAGATPAPPGTPGDVILPDGTPAWIDAGPLRVMAPIDGAAVLSSVAVEHRGLRPPLGNDTTADLAPDQLAAVTHPGGAARIIAPAGSGKTRVLTERARHLLQRWQLPAGAVSLVAFNRRAQVEMRERTADLPGLQVRTLNSIALAIVNGVAPFAPQPRRLDTIDEGEVRRILGRLLHLPRRRNADPLAPYIEALTLIRLGLVAPDDAEERYGGDVDGLAALWPRYRSELDARGVVDFDGQIHRAIELLLTEPDVRAAAQRACRVLLVDEFQDLTPAHLLLVRLLASPGFAVFGVGDDDQTIYGYNGADPAWLIDFEALFPGAGDHPLEVNYRCPPAVVERVDRLLVRNRRRVRKVIRAAPGRAVGAVAAVEVRTAPGPLAETVDAVATALAAGRPPGDIAVLTRVNALLAPVQVALRRQGIPVAAAVGTEVCDRTAIRAVLAWLRLATDPGHLRGADLGEALRRPSRPMAPRVAEWVTEQRSIEALRRLATRVTNDREAGRIDDFATDIARVQTMVAQGGTTADVVRTVVDGFDLAGSVSTLDLSRRGMNRASQSDDLTAVAELAAMQPDPAGFEPWLRRLLAEPSDPAGVVLATVHRVKGQEWPLVVVHRADADQLPHRLADDVEEERRLFHVALTRASERVVVVCGPDPSPFVAELDRDPGDDPPMVEPVGSRREPPRPATAPKGDADVLTGPDAVLYEALRAMRNQLRAGKPAYTVFHDSTLRDIARARPRTLEALGHISGIGTTKLERYGDAVLAVVEEVGDAG
jgi:DNA helicase-2/ATP-dependent DNA helicase PcrA